MKKWILITAAVMLAVGLVLGSAFVALAQSGTPPTPFGGFGAWMGRGMMRGWGYGQAYTGTVPFGGPMMRGWGYGGPITGTTPFGPGMMGAWGGPMSDMHTEIWAAVAKELGLTLDQLQAELSTKTLDQLAQEKGVTLQKLQEAAQSAWKTEINDLVESGQLTREQADWMIQHMNSVGFGMMFGQGRGFGPCGPGGMFGGPQGQGAPQGFGPRGGRGRGPGMMGRQS